MFHRSITEFRYRLSSPFTRDALIKSSATSNPFDLSSPSHLGPALIPNLFGGAGRRTVTAFAALRTECDISARSTSAGASSTGAAFSTALPPHPYSFSLSDSSKYLFPDLLNSPDDRRRVDIVLP